MLRNNNHIPDVLDCLANLSNDEVFTPPKVVNQMLDLLPEEVFKSRETTFLDPFTKSGVFLREITKRLLEHQVPNYKDTASKIERVTKIAIQDAVRKGELIKEDKDFEEKASIIGDAAIKNHEDAVKFILFEKQLQDALDHILKKQVFGIAITELTANLARRSLYCSKDASGKYSISEKSFLGNKDGNIRFVPMKHIWKNGSCVYCGASASINDRPDDYESHAYEFIHTDKPKEIWDMEFTVICGNPPYQLGNGGGNGSSATPIYQKFVEQAKKLNPRYLTMIIPSRWMFGGIGLNKFRYDMLHDLHLSILYDYIDEHMCFSSNDIPGGVCYFLYDSSHNTGMCEVHHITSDNEYVANRYLSDSGDTFIRNPILASIQKKVQFVTSDFMYNLASANRPYGFRRDFLFKTNKYMNVNLFDKPVNDDDVHIFGLSSDQKRIYKWMERKYVQQGVMDIDKYKLFIPAVYGCPAIGAKGQTSVIQEPVLGYPSDICTETFLSIGSFDNENYALNCKDYLCTKFVRCLIGAQKQSQSASRIVYKFVPVQDFSKSWTDEELYKKYNLTQEEINFIESMIKQM